MNNVEGREYGISPDGLPVTEFTITNRQGMEVKVINYGCTITSLKAPDRDGRLADVVLGYDTMEGYLMSKHYLGCVVGRYANRIAHGRFNMDHREYALATNLPPHHLHGGHKGFDKAVWSARPFENESGSGIDFYYLSADGEEGFPGNVQVYIRYFLGHENIFIISYLAETDESTIINLSQHSYFNLSGDQSNILEHGLIIHANHYLPVDESMIPTGEIRSVTGTPFDFRSVKFIGRDIKSMDDQLRIAHGYDHNWILAKEEDSELSHAATLYDPASGRVMEVHTSEPGVQLYTANFLDDLVVGKNNTHYQSHAGLCLETQHYPDSPNHPEFPSVKLNPGTKYQSTTLLAFSTK